jgi:hypothetical protein
MNGQPPSSQRLDRLKITRRKETLAPAGNPGNFIKHDRKAHMLMLTAG